MTPTRYPSPADRLAALARRDALVSRCPLCGAWRWSGRCYTPHTPTTERVTTNG